MKNRYLVILILFILIETVFPQNYWKPEISLNFLVQSNTKVSSFVDENGIHIVYSRNGGIRYALINAQGGVIKYDRVIETEGSGTDYANVVAIDNSIFAIYYKNNKINVARSTNLGENWNNSFTNYDLIYTDCNKIIAYKGNDNDIHITWSERRMNSYYNDVHYINLLPNNEPLVWTGYKNISENDYAGGQIPDFVIANDKVDVNYYNWTGLYNREKVTDNPWNNSESIPFYQLPLGNQVKTVKPHVVGNSLNVLYQNCWSGWSQSGVLIGHSYRPINGTQWIDNQNILITDNYSGSPYPFISANTADGKIHLIYWDKDDSRFSYKQLNGTTFSSHIAEIPMAILSNSMNAVSNDLFYLRIDNPLTPGSISFRHYDAAPLAPQNLSVVKSATNHPLLSWGKNKEPDIQYYKIYKYSYSELGWQLIGTTASTSFEDVSEIFLSPGNYVANEHWIYYKITAVDNYPHESSFSNQVGARVRGAALEKENNQLQVTDYSLSQNYPNPFNPTTSISYAVPAESHIQIKVYDLLGREVAELVNETKQTGYYSIEFNASGFSSGIFIYRITAINGERILFSESKRMLLIK
jgi:hypothetical protein